MSWMVTKPVVQTVESILKPNYYAGGITKKGIKITTSTTMARIQDNIYKALIWPTQGTQILLETFTVILLLCFILQRTPLF